MRNFIRIAFTWLCLSFLTLSLGCDDTIWSYYSVSARSGLRDYETPWTIPVLGGNVNPVGGNFILGRGDLRTASLFGHETIRQVYNSTPDAHLPGGWLFNFETTYTGETLVDFTGAVHTGLSELIVGEVIPGTFWVKGEDTATERTVVTKGGVVYAFDLTTNQLIQKRHEHQVCPSIDYVWDPSGTQLDIHQNSCDNRGGPGYNWNQLLYTVVILPGGQVSSVADRAGEAICYLYGTNLETVVPCVDVGQAGKEWFQYEYDAAGYLSAITNPEAERTELSYWQEGWDPAGPMRIEKIALVGGTEPIEHTFSYWRAVNDSVTLYTNPLGEKRRFSITNANRVTAKVEYLEDGLEESFVYDPGTLRPKTHNQVDGTVIEYVCDANENVVERADPAGNTTYYTYAPVGNNGDSPYRKALLRVEDELIVGAGRTLIEERTYDGYGQLLSVTTATGPGTEDTVALVYGVGAYSTRLDKVIYPSGVELSFDQYNDLGQATETSAGGFGTFRVFNATGRLQEGADTEFGGILDRTYDKFGNPDQIRVAGVDSDGNLSATEAVVLAFRGSDGRPLSVGRSFNADHLFIYDAVGCNTEMQEKVNGAWVSTYYTCDNLGRRNLTLRPNGMEVALEWNQLGQVTRKSAYRDSILEGELIVTYAGGKPISAQDTVIGNTETYSYDLAGRLGTVTYSLHGETLSFEYDRRSREVAKTWSLANQLPVARIEREFDWAGRETRVVRVDGIDETLLIDRTFMDGEVVSVETGNGLRRDFTYNPSLGHANGSITTDLVTDTMLEATSVTFAATETTPSIWEIHTSSHYYAAWGMFDAFFGLGPVAEPGTISAGMRILYADLDSTIGPSHSETYSWDANSNRLPVGNQNITYNTERNRTLSSDAGGSLVTLAYDEAGFVEERNGVPITWTAVGRLDSAGALNLEWDMQGRLVSASDGIRSKDLSWWGGSIEVDSNNVAKTLDLGQAVLGLQGGGEYYRHLDLLRGNIQFTSDGSGEIHTVYEYGAYCRVSTHGNSDGIAFGGGVEYEGISVLGERMYDCQTGEFWSPDPVFNALNQRSYTLGNPILFSDFDGLESKANARIQMAAALAGLGLAVVATAAAAGAPPVVLGAAVIGLGLAVAGVIWEWGDLVEAERGEESDTGGDTASNTDTKTAPKPTQTKVVKFGPGDPGKSDGEVSGAKPGGGGPDAGDTGGGPDFGGFPNGAPSGSCGLVGIEFLVILGLVGARRKFLPLRRNGQ